MVRVIEAASIVRHAPKSSGPFHGSKVTVGVKIKSWFPIANAEIYSAIRLHVEA